MKKRDFPWALLFILLFFVFTVPGSVEFTPNANSINHVNQEPTGIAESDDVWDHTFPAPAFPVVTLTATKTDALFTDNNSNSEADPGDVISYTIVIQNSGDMAAEDVVFDDTIDPNTTLVGSSLSITPIARNDSYATTGNISISVPDGANDVLANDNDPDGGALTGVTAVQGSDSNVGAATETTATGLNSVKGSVTMQADGSFSYEPPPGFTGTDTFTYQVTDDEGDTDTATVSIVISDMVWFVDNSSGGSNLGTFSDPFTSTTSFNSAQGAPAPNPTDGDVIFIYQGTENYTDGINLRDSQVLLGQGIDLLTELGNLGITQSTFSDLTSSPASGAGNRPTLTDGSGNGIDLASGNTLKGLNVGNTSGIGVTGTSVGNLAIDEMGITGSGKAFDVNGGGTLSIDLDEVTVTSSASGGFSLQSTSGTTTISNVDITTTGGTGLLASSAGTFTVTGSGNQIGTTSGRAINLTNTTIGSSDVTFESISASGGNNGIVLNNTGSTGGFTVTGNGGACTAGTPTCTGGRIQSTTGANGAVAGNGVYLADTGPVSLSFIRIDNHTNHAIFGSTVNGFSLIDALVDGANGNDAGSDEGSVRFVNLLGSAAITRAEISGGLEDNLRLVNNTGTLDRLVISNSTFSNNSNDLGNDGILLEARNSAVVNVTVDNSTFSAHRGDHFDAAATDNASLDLVFTNNNMSGGHPNALGQSFILSNAQSSDVTFDVSDNSINGSIVTAFIFFQSASSTVASSIVGTFSGNTIGSTGVAGSGSVQGNGVTFNATGNGTMTGLADGNTIRQWSNGHGFEVSAGDGSPVVNVTATNNLIKEPDTDAFPINGLHLNAGTTSAGVANVCFDVQSNDMVNAGVSGVDDFRLRQRNSSTVNLPGYGGGSGNTGAVVAFVQGNNTGTPTGSAAVSGSGGGFTGTGSSCTTPAKAISDKGLPFSSENVITSDLANIKSESVQYRPRAGLNAGAANTITHNDSDASKTTTVRTTPVYLASAESAALILPNESGTEIVTRTIPGKIQTGPAPMLFSGENINVNLGMLDPGQEVTIEFRATIDDPLSSGVDRVQNQSTVSGSNFDDVLTSDPDPNSGFPPSGGETITPLNVELDLTLTIAEGWRMLASPIDGLTYQEMLEDLWTQGIPTGADYDGGIPNIYTWPNDATGTDPGNWDSPEDLNQAIPAGTGFLMFVFEDDEFGVPTDPPFPKTITLSGTTYAGNIEPQMNSTTDGWTLVGNPYIVPVDFGTLSTSNLTGVAYVYDSNLTGVGDPGPINDNDGGWRTTDGNYGDLTDGIIAAGQGFLVQNNGGVGSLTFTEADKTTGGQLYGKQNQMRDFVRLEVRGESGYNAVWIRFSGEGSKEPMYGDALELQPLSQQYALLGARKADGTLFDIAHFPLPDEQLEIPLAVEATRGGSYTITATRMDLPAGTGLYLHDLETGETRAIDASLEYDFTLRDIQKAVSKEVPVVAGGPAKATAIGDNRFMITTYAEKPARELPEAFALDQNYPNPFNPATVISYQLPVNSEVRLEVYDMLGRRVAELVSGRVAAGRHTVSFDASGLSSGIYLYRLQAGSQIMTKKLTVLK